MTRMPEESPHAKIDTTATSGESATQARLPTPPETASLPGFGLQLSKISSLPENSTSQGEQATETSTQIVSHTENDSNFPVFHATSMCGPSGTFGSEAASPYGQLRLGQPKIPVPDPVTGVFGTSYADASVNILPPFWKPPMGPTPFPTSDRESQLLVRQLRDALLNTTDTKDNKTVSYKANWTLGKSLMFLEWQADRVCWEILHETIKLHKHGFVAPIFERDPNKHVDKDLEFGERITALVNLLNDWKSICDVIMKGEKLVVFVAGPAWTYIRCESNKQGNAQRKQLIEAGKSARAKVGGLTDREKSLEKKKSSGLFTSPTVSATKTTGTIGLCGEIEGGETTANDQRPEYLTTSDGYLESSPAPMSSPAPLRIPASRLSPIDFQSSPPRVPASKPPTTRPTPTLGTVSSPSLRSSPIVAPSPPSQSPSSSPIGHARGQASQPLRSSPATQNVRPVRLDSIYKSNPIIAPAALPLAKQVTFAVAGPSSQGHTVDSASDPLQPPNSRIRLPKKKRPAALDADLVTAANLPKAGPRKTSKTPASSSNKLPPVGIFSSVVPRSPLIRSPNTSLPSFGAFASVVPAKRGAEEELEGEEGRGKGGK